MDIPQFPGQGGSYQRPFYASFFTLPDRGFRRGLHHEPV
ncbi:hypothetical protein SynPROS71_02416 [Synechococcus sp. PROS-7-1]|nr:hypothetical protein SynPROS71_02416 [Synechococcus sp. PROS-7-1]